MAIPASFPEHSAFSNKPKSTECLCDEMEKGQNAPGGRKTKVYFALRTNCARPWERMFICGGNRLLGNWRPEKALEMARETEDGEENQSQQKTNSGRNQSSSSVWRVSIELGPEDSQRLLRFRFFLGFPLQTDPSNCQSSLSLLVVRWEAQMSPRCILPSVESNSMGECNKGVTSEFGSYGGRDRLIMDGWLHGREQRQIFLRMFGTALRFFDPKLSEKRFLIRVTPCDVRMDKEFDFANSNGPVGWRTPSLYVHSLDSLAEEEDHPQQNKAAPPLPSHSFTEFANLLSDADPFFREQSENGEPFRNDGEDYFVFRTTSVAIEFLAFRIELFMLQQRNWTSTESKIGLTPSRFALAYCMPSSMPDTIGSLSLPLVAVKTQKPMGQIKVDYLLATSVDWEEEEEEKHATRMETTFVKHWKKRRTLEVGHRGSGESFTKFATARENTIFSLNNAAQRGADFVEFDVQLSRDRSVVVFHDFHVLVSVATRNAQLLGHPSAEETKNATANPGSKSETNLSERTEAATATDGGGELHKIAVRDLSLAQLRLLHVHHYKEAENISEIGQQQNRGHRLTGEADERDELRSFPTLVEALQRVDEHAGFNVEIKYPMRMRDGSHECENYFERNQYMDQLLVDVFRHAGKRRIVFSSFDPDICTLLSVKQNKYPVLFLCVGQTDRYVPFLDERSKVTRVGTNFAACSNLLGINLHSEELLSDPSSLKRAVAMKLITFVWGEDLDKLEHVAYFRRQNVDAIIYDRIGELETRQNVFVVEREVKSALFKSPRTSPSLSRANSLFRNSQSPTMPVEEPRRSPSNRRMLANGFARQMTIANTDFFPTK